MLAHRAASVFALVVLVFATGCGSISPALRDAESTVALTSRVVTDLEVRVDGVEDPGADGSVAEDERTAHLRALRAAVRDASALLTDAEQALALWHERGRSGAWHVVAPCLGRALGAAEDAMVALGLEPSPELSQAVQLTQSETRFPCAQRREAPTAGGEQDAR